MNTQVHDTTGRSPYELVFGQIPREVVFPSSKKSAIILEDLEADGVVLDSVDCHNSAISSNVQTTVKNLVRKVISVLVRIQMCLNVIMMMTMIVVLVSLSVFKRMMTSIMKPVVLMMVLGILMEVWIVW